MQIQRKRIRERLFFSTSLVVFASLLDYSTGKWSLEAAAAFYTIYALKS